MSRLLAVAAIAALVGSCAPPPSDPPTRAPTVRETPRPATEVAPAAKAPPAATALHEGKTLPEPVVDDILIGERREQDPRATEATPSDEGGVNLAPDQWDPTAFARPRRRMSVGQVRRTLRDVTGGPGWTDAQGNDKWAPLNPTLGVPDWFVLVTEDLRPGSTFIKFLRDAAIEVCLPLVQGEMDPNVVAPEDRIFLVHADPAAVPVDDQATRANITYLVLRFHGRREAVDSAEVDVWTQLVTGVAADTGSTAEAWQAMCIGLIIHPRFYSY